MKPLFFTGGGNDVYPHGITVVQAWSRQRESTTIAAYKQNVHAIRRRRYEDFKGQQFPSQGARLHLVPQSVAFLKTWRQDVRGDMTFPKTGQRDSGLDLRRRRRHQGFVVLREVQVHLFLAPARRARARRSSKHGDTTFPETSHRIPPSTRRFPSHKTNKIFSAKKWNTWQWD